MIEKEDNFTISGATGDNGKIKLEAIILPMKYIHKPK